MAVDVEELKEKIKIQEGCINHMYLDTRGYVTVGVGHLIRDPAHARELPFVFRRNGSMATADEIINEYHILKEQPVGLRATSYEPYTQLILPDTEIESLLDQHIEEFTKGLKSNFQGFDDFPPPAQEALYDMAFNLGMSGLINKFPKMVAAAQNGQWNVCATECRRTGISDSRNLDTKKLFESCW